MNRTWLIRLLVLGFFALAVVVVMAQSNDAFRISRMMSPASTEEPNPTFAPDTEPLEATEAATPVSTASAASLQTKIFSSSSMRFSMTYPDDLRVTNNSATEVRFFKAGPTQQQGSEIYDGISVTINSGRYTESSFADFVKVEQQKVAEDGVSTITSPTKPITIAGLSGYEFSSRGLGDFRHIYLPTEIREYLHIVDGTVDPGNASGFEATVTRMLNSIELAE